MSWDTLSLVLLALLIIACGGWVWYYAAKVEAITYNRMTGADLTTWEAMWTNVRVDCP